MYRIHSLALLVLGGFLGLIHLSAAQPPESEGIPPLKRIVRVEAQNATIDEVLANLSQEYEFNFILDSYHGWYALPETFSLQNVSLRQAFDEIAQRYGYQWSEVIHDFPDRPVYAFRCRTWFLRDGELPPDLLEQLKANDRPGAWTTYSLLSAPLTASQRRTLQLRLPALRPWLRQLWETESASELWCLIVLRQGIPPPEAKFPLRELRLREQELARSLHLLETGQSLPPDHEQAWLSFQIPPAPTETEVWMGQMTLHGPEQAVVLPFVVSLPEREEPAAEGKAKAAQEEPVATDWSEEREHIVKSVEAKQVRLGEVLQAMSLDMSEVNALRQGEGDPRSPFDPWQGGWYLMDTHVSLAQQKITLRVRDVDCRAFLLGMMKATGGCLSGLGYSKWFRRDPAGRVEEIRQRWAWEQEQGFPPPAWRKQRGAGIAHVLSFWLQSQLTMGEIQRVREGETLRLCFDDFTPENQERFVWAAQRAWETAQGDLPDWTLAPIDFINLDPGQTYYELGYYQPPTDLLQLPTIDTTTVRLTDGRRLGF